ncbi:hypothetical protein COBT_004179 [Conglomerata obtusa]
MTDKQLLDIIYTKPLNRQDFIDSLGRMFPLIREHMCDIILIIKKTMEANDEHNNIENAEKNHLEMKVESSSINEGKFKKSAIDKRIKEYNNENLDLKNTEDNNTK